MLNLHNSGALTLLVSAWHGAFKTTLLVRCRIRQLFGVEFHLFSSPQINEPYGIS
jgi:hypothetical protein